MESSIKLMIIEERANLWEMLVHSSHDIRSCPILKAIDLLLNKRRSN